MAKYSKAQMTVIALWVLARSKDHLKIPDATAPEIIANVVNQLGEKHSRDSVLLQKHGFDRLLLGRKIDKDITTLHQEVARELVEAGVVAKVFDV